MIRKTFKREDNKISSVRCTCQGETPDTGTGTKPGTNTGTGSNTKPVDDSCGAKYYGDFQYKGACPVPTCATVGFEKIDSWASRVSYNNFSKVLTSESMLLNF